MSIHVESALYKCIIIIIIIVFKEASFELLAVSCKLSCFSWWLRFFREDIRKTMLSKYLSNPDYNFEKVNRASLACGPLVKWAIAQVCSTKVAILPKSINAFPVMQMGGSW